MPKPNDASQDKRFRLIGLTGPIGAGKDEVARILSKHGAYIISADSVAHQLYASQSPVWHALVKTFGSKILMRGGKVNRKKLGGIVFSDKKKLAALNQIIHPALKEAIKQIIIDIIEKPQPRENKPAPQLIAINAAVLKEIGLVDLVDEVWVVLATKETRLKRLVKKGLPKSEAEKRVRAQAGIKDYLQLADIVIKNDGTRKQLNAEIQAHLQI